MRSLRLATFAMTLVTAAWAQQPTTFQGNWVGTMPGLSGSNQLGVELTLSENAGTFLQRLPAGRGGRKNPCFGREFPVTVVSQSGTEATIEIDGDKVLPGCIHEAVSLKAADAKSLEGTLKDGRVLKLTRQ